MNFPGQELKRRIVDVWRCLEPFRLQGTNAMKSVDPGKTIIYKPCQHDRTNRAWKFTLSYGTCPRAPPSLQNQKLFGNR